MPENNSDEMIKFAATGKPAKFGDAFGDLMKDKVNAGVEAIRAKVAAKLAGLDPTGEVGDGAEEGEYVVKIKNTVGSCVEVSVLKNSADATSADAAPPKPLKIATS